MKAWPGGAVTTGAQRPSRDSFILHAATVGGQGLFIGTRCDCMLKYKEQCHHSDTGNGPFNEVDK